MIERTILPELHRGAAEYPILTITGPRQTGKTTLAHAGYVANYLERGLHQLTAIQNLAAFPRFLELAAGNVGQLLNASRLGDDVGVDQKTIERWITLLEASYLVVRVQPYRTNIRKRLIRSPKLYFLDTGLVCYLLGIQAPAHLVTHPLRGAIFENWVAAELVKQAANQGLRPELCFWRTYDGQEIDVLRHLDGVIEFLECKSGQTVQPRFLASMNRVATLFADANIRQRLVYGGEERMELRGVQVMSWRCVDEQACDSA